MTDRRAPGTATGQGHGEPNPALPAGQERGNWAGQPLPRHRPTTANFTSNGQTDVDGAGTTLAPCTGPLATRTVRHTPNPASCAPTSMAEAADVHRNAHVGPDPATIPASAPASAPARSVRRSPGSRLTAAGCRSLPSSGASSAGSPDASAASTGSGSSRRGGWFLPAPAVSRNRSISLNTAGVGRPPSAKANTQWNMLRVRTVASSSPRPVPSAVPPRNANGTSLPS